jgi:Cof subfamily protein (haloacid dehalogenase superfamily)
VSPQRRSRAGIKPEPEYPIRLLALDIDGTLVGDDLVIGERTSRAIREAVARGVAVSLVTGRMVSSAMRFARELGLTAPVVGYQGGLIRDMPAPGSSRLGRLLFHRPLPAETAREVLLWTRSVGLDPHVNHLERFILRADDPRAEDYSSFMGARAELVPDIVAATVHPVTKVLAVGEPPQPSAMAEPARERFSGRCDVTISHPRFLEFVAPGVSKGRAVRFLARRAGIPLGAAMAIGDQWNDLEMLAEVGHGAAMPTAPLQVRSVARYVAPPLDDEGVGRMIETLVLADPERARAAGERLADEARQALEPSDAEEVAERRRAAAAETADSDARTGEPAETAMPGEPGVPAEPARTGPR